MIKVKSSFEDQQTFVSTNFVSTNFCVNKLCVNKLCVNDFDDTKHSAVP